MESTEDVISDEELDKRYRELIDSFIDHANELSAHNSIENVGLALLFAASRFNAYVVSSTRKLKIAMRRTESGLKLFSWNSMSKCSMKILTITRKPMKNILLL